MPIALRWFACAFVSLIVAACGGASAPDIGADASSGASSSSGGSSSGGSSSGGSSSGGSSSGGSSSGGSSSGSSGAGGCVTVTASQFDTSCQVDSDCIAVPTGQLCNGGCACNASAINASGRPQYDKAVAGVQHLMCPCSYVGASKCVNHHCTMCGQVGADPACPDGG